MLLGGGGLGNAVLFSIGQAMRAAGNRVIYFAGLPHRRSGMEVYAKGDLGPQTIRIDEVDHLVAIGSDRMMAAIKDARHGRLKPYLKAGHAAIGSINSPMECMMKGICAQCLCKQIDPASGEEYFVYSCYNPHQELDRVDFENLNARLRQNSVREKLSNPWLDLLLKRDSIGRARSDPGRIAFLCAHAEAMSFLQVDLG